MLPALALCVSPFAAGLQPTTRPELAIPRNGHSLSGMGDKELPLSRVGGCQTFSSSFIFGIYFYKGLLQSIVHLCYILRKPIEQLIVQFCPDVKFCHLH